MWACLGLSVDSPPHENAEQHWQRASRQRSLPAAPIEASGGSASRWARTAGLLVLCMQRLEEKEAVGAAAESMWCLPPLPTAAAAHLTEAACPFPPCSKGGVAEGDEQMEFETSKGVKVVSSFDAMGLREDLLRGIYQFGFEKPSAIQQRAILPIVQVCLELQKLAEGQHAQLLQHAARPKSRRQRDSAHRVAAQCFSEPPTLLPNLQSCASARPAAPAGPRRDCAGAVGHGQDQPDCHHALPDAGHHTARVSMVLACLALFSALAPQLASRTGRLGCLY